jgi:hypothetical protein
MTTSAANERAKPEMTSLFDSLSPILFAGRPWIFRLCLIPFKSLSTFSFAHKGKYPEQIFLSIRHKLHLLRPIRVI